MDTSLRSSLPITGIVRGCPSTNQQQIVSVPRPQTPHRARPILIAFLAIPIVTFSTTYAMSLLIERHGKPLIVYPSYFLSQSIARKPASCVGTFGLSFACMLIPILALFRHRQVEMKGPQGHEDDGLNDTDRTPRYKVLNDRALKAACTAAVSGLGVASFQSSIDDCGGTYAVKTVHWIFAFVFFMSGMIYSVLMWRIDRYVPELGTQRSRSLRKYFAILTGAQLFILFVLVPVFIFAKLVEHTRVIVTASVFEITLFMTFMSTYLTFYDDFAQTAFSLLVLYDGAFEGV